MQNATAEPFLVKRQVGNSTDADIADIADIRAGLGAKERIRELDLVIQFLDRNPSDVLLRDDLKQLLIERQRTLALDDE